MELSTGTDTLGTTPNKNIFAFKGNENISKKGAEYTYTPEQILKLKNVSNHLLILLKHTSRLFPLIMGYKTFNFMIFNVKL